jgi:hypothetical protein
MAIIRNYETHVSLSVSVASYDLTNVMIAVAGPIKVFCDNGTLS